MTAFLFLQRFEGGIPVAMPFQPLMDVLSAHGKPGVGQGDAEITLAPTGIAAYCTVVGDAASGAACVGFDRPLFDADLRAMVWACVEQFGCAVFDDMLERVYVPLDGAAALPAELAAAATNGVRQVDSAQQLWPDGLETEIDSPPRPGARYTNANPNGPNLQFFDYAGADNALGIELRIRPEACNPGTLRVLRNLELRVDAAISTNPEYHAEYRFDDPESSLRLMKSLPLGMIANRAIIVSPPPGTGGYKPHFVAERGAFRYAASEAGKLERHMREKYRIELDGSAASIDALAAVLDKAHAHHRQERAKHPPGQPFTSALAVNWAVKAGSYLGLVVQRQIGAQWGFLVSGMRRLPAVMTHGGRIRHPHLQVLDHILNGPRDSIAQWFRQLAQSDASATPRDEDLVSDIAGTSMILPGSGRFGNDAGLPMEEAIPRDRLDFSVDSLGHLDRYLAQVAPRAGEFSQHALANLCIAGGAYLGEVVRGNAADPAQWRWVNYDDFVASDPDFAHKRPRELGFMAFLDSEENSAYPLAHIAATLSGAQMPPTRDFARQLLGWRDDAGAADAAAALDEGPADTRMAGAIDEVRTMLDQWRRMATPADYAKHRVAGPDWLEQESLGDTVKKQAFLLERGQVVWGALIQANSDLFQPGPDDLPAALVYSRDPHFDGRPQALRRIGGALFGHKSKTAPEPFRRIGTWLADEYERAYDLPVPEVLSGHKAFATTFMVFRKHLPGGLMSGTWFPILVHPDTTARLIVPAAFWPQGLVTAWKARELVV